MLVDFQPATCLGRRCSVMAVRRAPVQARRRGDDDGWNDRATAEGNFLA